MGAMQKTFTSPGMLIGFMGREEHRTRNLP
jgi:hypothetical protein